MQQAQNPALGLLPLPIRFHQGLVGKCVDFMELPGNPQIVHGVPQKIRKQTYKVIAFQENGGVRKIRVKSNAGIGQEERELDNPADIAQLYNCPDMMNVNQHAGKRHSRKKSRRKQRKSRKHKSK